jgi:hypothetical protein
MRPARTPVQPGVGADEKCCGDGSRSDLFSVNESGEASTRRRIGFRAVKPVLSLGSGRSRARGLAPGQTGLFWPGGLRGARGLPVATASAATPHRQRYGRKPADADRPRRRRTQINDPPGHERTAIVDPHYHGAAVAIVDDGDARAEWQCPMSRCHGARIHALPTRGAIAAVD